MGSVMRRIRKAGMGRMRNRVAFDFESAPSFGPGRHDRGLHFGLGKTRITAGPDAVFLDESDHIRDAIMAYIHDCLRRSTYRDLRIEINDHGTKHTILAVDTGREEFGIVYLEGGKVVR